MEVNLLTSDFELVLFLRGSQVIDLRVNFELGSTDSRLTAGEWKRFSLPLIQMTNLILSYNHIFLAGKFSFRIKSNLHLVITYETHIQYRYLISTIVIFIY